jgi:hypothetical protein
METLAINGESDNVRSLIGKSEEEFEMLKIELRSYMNHK